VVQGLVHNDRMAGSANGRRRIAVTGATGGLGGRVARSLDAAGAALRLVVRDALRAPQLANADVAEATYADAEAMRAALTGVETLFMVSAAEAPDRVSLHATVVDAAVAAGVDRIVYTSFAAAGPQTTFTFGRDHWHAEQHIIGSGLTYTFLRDNLYLDMYPRFVGADGVLAGPGGDGRAAAVARDDVADAAIAVLLDDSGRDDGQTYNLTGPAAISFAEAAAAMAAVTGRSIRYHAESVDEAYASRASYGRPKWEVDGWVTSYTCVAAGDLQAVSDDVPRLTGHPATSFGDYLGRHPQDWAHLRA
jgi:NAD(P)H dehydrogenase (quinone)